MKIKQYSFKIDKINTIELNKNFSYPNLNLYSLCYYINQKAYKINALYQLLIPLKITNLKECKKLLLDFYKNHANQISGVNGNALIILNDFIKKYPNTQINAILENLNNSKNAMLSLKDSLNYIDKRIKFYYSEKKHKNDYMPYQINQYDLTMLKDGRITENVKKVSYYYLIKLKRVNISNSALNYINSPIVSNILKEYSKSDIIKDIDLNLKDDLIKFEDNFLNRVI